MGIAAASAGAAGSFRDYWPAGATQRVTQDQQLLLRYRAVGQAEVQRMEIEAPRPWLAVGK